MPTDLMRRQHGAELLREGLGDLTAFGRDYIANPDLVERIGLDASDAAGTASGTGAEQTD